MSHKILNLFGDTITKEALDVLQSLGTVDSRTATHGELAGIVDQYDVIFMGLYPNFSAEVLRKAVHLKAIATAVTNPTHIDQTVVRDQGITIISLKDEIEFLKNITGTAEIAVGLIIDLMRFTPWAFDDVKAYHWDRESFRGQNLYGKTLGIYGFGRLGTWMARYGNAFNMRVIAHSPHLTQAQCSEHGCSAVDFATLLRESDVLSLNATLVDTTRRVFSASAFTAMKKSAYLINTTVGGIVDEADLLAALERKEIAGYGTDVLDLEESFETSFSNHPLVEYAKVNRNVIIIPHIGGMTRESRAATDIFLAGKVKSFLEALHG